MTAKSKKNFHGSNFQGNVLEKNFIESFSTPPSDSISRMIFNSSTGRFMVWDFSKGWRDVDNVQVLRFTIGGAGTAITTGGKGMALTVPWKCKITKWRILADVSGSIVLDVWRDTYANYPPTNADSIMSSNKPTLSSAIKNESSTLTSWNTTLNEGDVLDVEVESASTVTKVTLELFVERIG